MKKPVTVPLILSVPSGNVWVTSIEHVRSWPCGFFFAAVSVLGLGALPAA